ncbi:ABC transporter permease [Arthrobacter rhombi]|uniref:ABC transporter permease protein n=1 Tax=Arthrobacter rhombi TaxID=71253 RepID=A0A1R4FSW6_9MICC|nr:ABC transporter permease [Arthrobacter rhombi]SJM58931.1 ABC transporter permease protein [Arthrobacter rhombi]
MNATFIRIDLTRQLRDVMNLMFVLILPALMYVIFGLSFGYGDQASGHGNVKFYIMASMAAYGASVAATAVTGVAAVELMQGWGRQIALTPLRPAGFVAGKAVVALAITALAIAVVFVVGALTGARVDSAWMWPVTFVIALVGSVLFSLFGYAIAMLFKSDSAMGVASGALVLVAFLGNVFIPLTGTLLQVARFTPMYGYVGLVRWPILEGAQAQSSDVDPLWGLIANLVAWLLIFGTVAVLAVRRGQSRR